MIARILDDYMRRNGLTQRELADKLDKQVSYVNKVLKGQAMLTLNTIVELEEKLGLPLLNPPRRRGLQSEGIPMEISKTGQQTGLLRLSIM